MKLQMMTLSQLPHFLRFSVRMLCLQVFFIAIFISSQTPFSYSDSTIFISEDSYLYVEPPVDISHATSLSGNNQVLSKHYDISKRKASLKLKLSSISKNQINPLSQISFTIPKSSHYLGNSSNLLTTAILGNPSQAKQHQKMMDSSLRVFLDVNLAETKLLYNIIINHFNLLKITINYFGRPPPIFAIFHQTQMTRIIKHK